MNLNWINNLFVSVMLLFTVSAVQLGAAEITVKAELDSAYIIMGKQTTLHIEIIEDENENANGILPIANPSVDTIISQVEIIERSNADTSSLGNNRRQIKQDLIIQSFDSGLYTLPPVKYIVGSDTFRSKSQVLKVIPVVVDSLPTIHGQANVIAPNTRWYDYLPDFITDYWGWILLSILLIAGVVIFIIFRKKEIKLPLMPQKKPIPPYELAIQQLTKLREEKLCERGQEKEFYTRLIDILRVYLDSRFGINAMEMTSTQIIDALNSNNEVSESRKYIKQILEIADFVKFAKVRPLPDDNIKSFNWATQFVEETKPIETPNNQNSGTASIDVKQKTENK